MKSTMRSGLGLVAMTVVVFATDWTNEQKEEFLRTAHILETRTLGMGITNSTKATMEDGTAKHAAHIQAIDEYKARFEGNRGTEMNFRDSYRYNIAAYRLAKLLDVGTVPPSVERKFRGSSAAITWWVDDAAMTELERFKKKIAPPDMVDWNRQMNTVHVFDQLIYNTDRNLGNLVITSDWQIWMIDHTRAFRLMNSCPNPKMLRQIDNHLLERLRSLTPETVASHVGGYLNKMEIKGLLARRDQIVRFFDGQIAEKGATQVTFESARR